MSSNSTQLVHIFAENDQVVAITKSKAAAEPIRKRAEELIADMKAVQIRLYVRGTSSYCTKTKLQNIMRNFGKVYYKAAFWTVAYLRVRVYAGIVMMTPKKKIPTTIEFWAAGSYRQLSITLSEPKARKVDRKDKEPAKPNDNEEKVIAPGTDPVEGIPDPMPLPAPREARPVESPADREAPKSRSSSPKSPRLQGRMSFAQALGGLPDRRPEENGDRIEEGILKYCDYDADLASRYFEVIKIYLFI